MDNTPIISSGVTGAIIAILYVLYKVCKHSSCNSNCCGKKSSIEVNLSPTEPETKPEIKV